MQFFLSDWLSALQLRAEYYLMSFKETFHDSMVVLLWIAVNKETISFVFVLLLQTLAFPSHH